MHGRVLKVVNDGACFHGWKRCGEAVSEVFCPRLKIGGLIVGGRVIADIDARYVCYL